LAQAFLVLKLKKHQLQLESVGWALVGRLATWPRRLGAS